MLPELLCSQSAPDFDSFRRAPFPLSRIPASIEHSMKLLCVTPLAWTAAACSLPVFQISLSRLNELQLHASAHFPQAEPCCPSVSVERLMPRSSPCQPGKSYPVATGHDTFFFSHKNPLSPHNRYSTHFFSIKMAELGKNDLVSCLIDFDDIQL